MSNDYKVKTFDVIDKRMFNLGLLYFATAGLVIATLFHSQYWVVLLAPISFYLGAMARGYNRIKGMYKVKELDKIVTNLKDVK